ncbi:MAG: molybdopterin-guanine dinucleotide biosynthesis protein B [Micropepsaceae bacterium]
MSLPLHNPQRVFGITGWKNSGKTTLVTALVTEFAARGYRVSTIKHAHHDFDIDTPGKDSHRHREAGASEVLVASATRWALMRELRGEQAPALDRLLTHLAPCDLVLIEGFKQDRHPKIEVVRSRDGERPIAGQDPTILAIATDCPQNFSSQKTLPLNDIKTIADFIAAASRLPLKTSRYADQSNQAV